jgi:uncharacterized protein
LFFGGLISGFFGGLSGNQGAFRSFFLSTTHLSKEAFVATSAAISSIVDVVRLLLYGIAFAPLIEGTNLRILSWALACSFLGILLGLSFFRKISMHWIRKWVTLLIYLLGILMIIGVI